MDRPFFPHDDVGLFLDQCCTLDPDEREQMKDLYAAFQKWSREERNVPEHRMKSMRTFGTALSKRSELTCIKTNRVFYAGIQIRDRCRCRASSVLSIRSSNLKNTEKTIV